MSEIDSTSREARAALPLLDLNLMTAFDVLLAERSVTKAAKHMSVSQSAMSHTLGRLRELLDDPVLVRAQGGMMPTPHAEALVGPIREGLTLLGRALSAPPTFDARTSTRTFRIAAPDVFCSLAAPPLWTHAQTEAPSIGLVFGPWTERSAAGLVSGDLDIAVMARLDVPDDDDAGRRTENELMRRTLLHDSFVCFVRETHPLAALFQRRRSKKSLQAFASAAHVLVSPDGRGDGVVDQVLAAKGLKRRVALRVPNFQSAILAAARADLIVTAPATLAADVDETLRPRELMVIQPPVDLPRHYVDMVWHKRFDADAGHAWLREALVEAVKGMTA